MKLKHSPKKPLSKIFIIGTRGSDLALWQANFIQSQLDLIGVNCSLRIIKTKGDEIQHLGFDKIEGKGFFTKEIEEALLNNEIDLAVHSHKDLETRQPDGLVIAALSERADASELLLIHSSAFDPQEKWGLKRNAVVGTSSSRRKAQLLHHRADVELKDIRGNVPTRIKKLREGDFDAILIAKAGVDRLALDVSDLHPQVLSPQEFVPAPAQGVLAIQCRADDAELIALLHKINDASTAELVNIERTVLHQMHGGCHLPLGVFVRRSGNEIEAHSAYAEKWDAPLKRIVVRHTDAKALPEIILRELRS